MLERADRLQQHFFTHAPARLGTAGGRGGVRRSDAHFHRLEIPYGRFERRLNLDLHRVTLVEKRLAGGILELVFRKKESA